jgi:prepilin-type N-terminal cleavage/methylation domain-containing protein
MTALVELRGRGGFTLIEMLITMAMMAIVMGMLLPATNKLQGMAERMETATSSPLQEMSASLRPLIDGTVKMQEDMVQLAIAAVNSGEEGTLDRTTLQHLCRDVLDGSDTVQGALAQISISLETDLTEEERLLLLEAQVSLTTWGEGARQLQAVISKVFRCSS